MFLLDTDVVSNFRKKPHPNLVAWLKAVNANDIAVSAMTVFEIQTGINYVREHDAAKAKDIDDWLRSFLLAGGMSILPVDADVARLYGNMFTTPELKNFLYPDPDSKRPKSGADLIIAATAIVHEATVVTINRADYERIHAHFPLPGLYEPFSDTFVVDPDAGALPHP